MSYLPGRTEDPAEGSGGQGSGRDDREGRARYPARGAAGGQDAGGAVPYSNLGPPGPHLSRREQVEHVTIGLVGRVGPETLARVRRLLTDHIPSLDLSSVRPWALHPLIECTDDEVRWRAAQALLRGPWSQARNPGGALTSFLHHAVAKQLHAAHKARRSSPPSERGRAHSRSPSRGPNHSRSRSRSRSRCPPGASTGSPSTKRLMDLEGDRDRASSGERRGRQVDGDREGWERSAGAGAAMSQRSGGAAGGDAPPGPEDAERRRWEALVRATSVGCMAWLPRPFVEEARQVLYSARDLNFAEIDASAWEPLLALPNCEQRLVTLKGLRYVRWEGHPNISASVREMLLLLARDLHRCIVGDPNATLPEPGAAPAGVPPPQPQQPQAQPPMQAGGARRAADAATVSGGAGASGGSAGPGRGTGDAGICAASSRPGGLFSPEFKEQMNRYLESLRGLDLAFVDEDVVACLSRLPNDRCRLACLQRLHGVNWCMISGREETQKRLRVVLERGVHQLLLKSHGPPGNKRSPGGGGGGGGGAWGAACGGGGSGAGAGDGGGGARATDPVAAGARGSVPSAAPALSLSPEFMKRMFVYLRSLGAFDVSAMDGEVLEFLSRMPDDGVRMDALRRLSGVDWRRVGGVHQARNRILSLLERSAPKKV